MTIPVPQTYDSENDFVIHDGQNDYKTTFDGNVHILLQENNAGYYN